MVDRKKEWIKSRFGNVDENVLGKIKQTKEISWPNLVKEYEVKGNKLRFQAIENIEESAERIAEIFRNAIDEMVGNSEYEWHHYPEEIIKRAKTGDWNFYGCYFDGKLISVTSMCINRGQRAMQWVWGCVDPIYRGKGVWKNIGEYLDMIVQMSGAQMGIVWVATTHKYSQMTAEQAGYKPMGCFVGGEYLGGSDGRYYRQNVIYYGKIYGEGKKYLQPWETMVLTQSAQKLVNTVKQLWKKKLKQISISIENSSGHLLEIIQSLSDAGIDLRALTMVDSGNFGQLRLLVSDLGAAQGILAEKHVLARVDEVVAVEIEDKPGSLARILKQLVDDKIDVLYMYAFVRSSSANAVMIFRFNDNDKAIETLQKNGITLLDTEDFGIPET